MERPCENILKYWAYNSSRSNRFKANNKFTELNFLFVLAIFTIYIKIEACI